MPIGTAPGFSSHQPATGRFVRRTAEEQAWKVHDRNAGHCSQVLERLATALWQEPERFERLRARRTSTQPAFQVDGKVRNPAQDFGHVRFNSVGGFDPNYPLRMINSVFECAEPCIWQGQNKVLFKRMLPAPQQPDYFLVVVRASEIGRVDVGSLAWRSEGTL